jgi:S1-C subfamily serine protease
MRLLLLLPAIVAAAPAARAQVRVETAPRAYAYVVGDPDRPMIGISTRNSGKRDTLGLLVESVTSGGPAEKAGIEEGDRLVSVNGVNLRLSPADAGESDMDGVANRRLIRELEKHKAGDEVELRVYRDGNTRSIRVKTVAADELNNLGFASTSGGVWRSMNNDRAALGISLGGNGSRRDTLGILVVGVANEGPAAKAGIDEGDRLAAVNNVDLRVASEDAGDWQASSARINRLNRELEKLKAGDTVTLRVISSGQARTVRVGSVKASEVDGEGVFRFSGPDGMRTITIPRVRALKVRPPAFEFQGYFDDANARLEMEKARRAFDDAFKVEKKATNEYQKQLKSLKSEVLKKATLSRSATI